jgi:hypothetical protein
MRIEFAIYINTVHVVSQNEDNIFSECLSILLLQTNKTDSNALDIDAIYNLKLRKTYPNATDKISMASIMPKQRECLLYKDNNKLW